MVAPYAPNSHVSRVRSRDFSGKVADILIDYRNPLLCLIVVITVALSLFARDIKIDPSAELFIARGSKEYRQWREYGQLFGNEEFILVAITTPRGIQDRRVLALLSALTSEAEKMDDVAEVLSLANLRVLQRRQGKVGNFPVMRNNKGVLEIPDQQELKRLRQAFPFMDFLLSADLRTVGALVRVNDESRDDPVVNDKVLGRLRKVCERDAPEGADVRIVGAATLRKAILSKSFETAVLYGLVCSLICVGITIHVFRSAKIAALSMGILGLGVFWALGAMSLLHIPLTIATSISFGLILITTLEITIHIITRFNQFREVAPDKKEAMRQAIGFLVRPFLFCLLTTAVGYGSCMIASFPLVFQFGLTMSVGILLSGFLAIVLASSFVMNVGLGALGSGEGRYEDLISKVTRKLERAITEHHRLFTVLGALIVFVMALGLPFIRVDAQILRVLGESTPEVADVRYVERHLGSLYLFGGDAEGRGRGLQEARGPDKSSGIRESASGIARGHEYSFVCEHGQVHRFGHQRERFASGKRFR